MDIDKSKNFIHSNKIIIERVLFTCFQVTIPVRFMFILLGPYKADVDYREIGRSISTLMSNSVKFNFIYLFNFIILRLSVFYFL